MAAAADADFMISVELVLAAPLVAEKLGLRWASAILFPARFFPPTIHRSWPRLLRLTAAPRWMAGEPGILDLGKLSIRHWWRPVRELRRELGLREECEPIFRDKFSPDLVLALFSSALAEPQPDWPGQTVEPGFVFYDEHRRSCLNSRNFLQRVRRRLSLRWVRRRCITPVTSLRRA